MLKGGPLRVGLLGRLHRAVVRRKRPKRIDGAAEDFERRALLVLVLQPESPLGHVGPRAGGIGREVPEAMRRGQQHVRFDELSRAFQNGIGILVRGRGNDQHSHPFERRQARVAGGRLGRRGLRHQLGHAHFIAARLRRAARIRADGVRPHLARARRDRDRCNGKVEQAHRFPLVSLRRRTGMWRRRIRCRHNSRGGGSAKGQFAGAAGSGFEGDESPRLAQGSLHKALAPARRCNL